MKNADFSKVLGSVLTNFFFLVSSGSIAVHPDSSVQLLAEEATLVENIDAKVKETFLINRFVYSIRFRLPKMLYLKLSVD